MPSTRLETRAGWIGNRHEALIAAVQRALVEAIRIPEQDRDIRIVEYPCIASPRRPARAPPTPWLRSHCSPDAPSRAKRRLYAALVGELAAFGSAASDLKIILHEVPRENWGLGGKAAVDIELGFKVEV